MNLNKVKTLIIKNTSGEITDRIQIKNVELKQNKLTGKTLFITANP